MADYGFQVFINGTSFDVINAFSPSYILDIITSASGTTTYDVPTGTALTARSYSAGAVYVSSNPTITVNGNTVTWSGNNGFQIVVYSE